MKADPRLLAYTIAFDKPGSSVYRSMAKLLASSLLRTGFGGDILIFHNHPGPFFLTGRGDLAEIYIEPQRVAGTLAEAGCRFKYAASDFIDSSQYDQILYLDCDCLALRNIDSLMNDSKSAIAYLPEKGNPLSSPQFQGHFDDFELEFHADLGTNGSNAGIWQVCSSDFKAVCEEVLRLYDVDPVKPPRFWGDQAQWNRVVFHGGFSTRAWDESEACLATATSGHFSQWSKSALLHFPGEGSRLPLMFGVFCYRFFGEAAPLLIDFLES